MHVMFFIFFIFYRWGVELLLVSYINTSNYIQYVTSLESLSCTSPFNVFMALI